MFGIVAGPAVSTAPTADEGRPDPAAIAVTRIRPIKIKPSRITKLDLCDIGGSAIWPADHVIQIRCDTTEQRHHDASKRLNA